MAHLLALAGRRIGVLAWLQVLSALDYLTESQKAIKYKEWKLILQHYHVSLNGVH